MSIYSGNIQLELRKFLAPEYIFGLEARLLAPGYCQKLGVQRLLLVTDQGLVKTPWYAELKAGLDALLIDTVNFIGVSANPRDTEVMEGAEIYRSHRCNMILALGGGSVLDCAKGIGIIASNAGHIRDYEGVDQIPNPIPPLVCVPTTGGTSADVSQFAIINNTQERYKMALISKALVPDVALVDPVLLTSMDSYLTACTGMDALSHAFEAFASNASSSFTDMYALEAIRFINENLLLSVESPDNVQARGKMMLASLYAGLAFSNASLGCVHSLAHSLGGYLDLPHGECNAILLPHVVAYNYKSIPERYKALAQAMGIPVVGLSTSEIKQYLIDCLIAMKERLQINSTLKNRGVGLDIIPVLAGKAINDPCNATNPRTPIKSDLETIYSEAL